MIDTLLKAQRAGKTVFGKEKAIKLLQAGSVEEIFISANCPEETVSKIINLAEIAGVKLTKLNETSEEIGTACKKPFHISVSVIVKSKEK